MSDLISRQEAVEEAKELFEMGGCYCDKFSIVGMLNVLPPVQPEIIRCRDCAHADKYHHCSFVNWWTGPDDYCSRAERRKDG